MTSKSTPWETRIEALEQLLDEARTRLAQYVGACVCPGMPCVTACPECNKTQDLVNRIDEALR